MSFGDVKFARMTPCEECPWRCDVATGTFPPERFKRLLNTIGKQDGFRPIFACHKAPEGAEYACAGYLLVEGLSNLAVRCSASGKRFDPRALYSPHPLYKRYEEMARANGLKIPDIDREVCGFIKLGDYEDDLLKNPEPKLAETQPHMQNLERKAVQYLQMWEGYELTDKEWEFLSRRSAFTLAHTQWRERAKLSDRERTDESFERDHAFAKLMREDAKGLVDGGHRFRPMEHLHLANDTARRYHSNYDGAVRDQCYWFLVEMFPDLFKEPESDDLETTP